MLAEAPVETAIRRTDRQVGERLGDPAIIACGYRFGQDTLLKFELAGATWSLHPVLRGVKPARAISAPVRCVCGKWRPRRQPPIPKNRDSAVAKPPGFAQNQS